MGASFVYGETYKQTIHHLFCTRFTVGCVHRLDRDRKLKIEQPKFNLLRAKYLTGKMKTVGIVLHDTAGNGGHGDTLYLANPGDGRKVSVDFTVERDGSIWKLNPDLSKYACLHAGRATRFKGLKNGQVTRSTVGIEITQHWKLNLTPTYTQEQVKSVAHLCAWLVQENKFVPADIVTHRQIIADGSRSDPRKFPFTEENGFWHEYWKLHDKGQDYLDSLVEKKSDVSDAADLKN